MTNNESSDPQVSYDHLDYDELTRIVLEEDSIDSEFIEDTFQATFKQVMALASQLGGAGRPEQAVEIDVLRFLIHRNMVGSNIRHLFNALDYKPSFIVMTMIAECETQEDGTVSNIFNCVQDGKYPELADFFANPFNSLMVVDIYRTFVGNSRHERYAPFVHDPTAKLLDQMALDLGVFPKFKRLDFDDKRVDDEGVPVTVHTLMRSLTISNTITPSPLIGQVFVIPHNPLYRLVAGSSVARDYNQMLEEAQAYIFSIMLKYCMSTTADLDSVEQVFIEYCNQGGFTPALAVVLWHNCNKDSKLMARVIIAASLVGSNDIEGMTQDACDDFMYSLYRSVQQTLIAGTYDPKLMDKVKGYLPNESLLLGEFAGQHNMETAPISAEEAAQDIPLPKSMIN